MPQRKRASTPFASLPLAPTSTLQHSLVPQLLLLRSNLSTINTTLETAHTTLLSLKKAKIPYKAREDKLYDEYIQCQQQILELDDREPGRGRRGWIAAMTEWENEMAGAEEMFRDVGYELAGLERKVKRFEREERKVEVEIGRLEGQKQNIITEIRGLEGRLGIQGGEGEEADEGKGEVIRENGKGKRKASEAEVDMGEESDDEYLDADGDDDSDLDYVEERPMKRPMKRLKKDDVPSRLKATAVVRWD